MSLAEPRAHLEHAPPVEPPAVHPDVAREQPRARPAGGGERARGGGAAREGAALSGERARRDARW